MSHYDDLWGPDSTHQCAGMCVVETTDEKSILTCVKGSANADDEWLMELSSKYSQCDGTSTAYATNVNNEQAMRAWVRALYNQISIYADRFNRNVGENRMLIDRCEPEFHRIPCSDHTWLETERDTLIFDCHFSTHDCALILKGNGTHINAYIVPASAWLALCATENEDYPLLERFSISGVNGMYTTVRLENSEVDLAIESNSIPFIAKYLFRQLILFSNKANG